MGYRLKHTREVHHQVKFPHFSLLEETTFTNKFPNIQKRLYEWFTTVKKKCCERTRATQDSRLPRWHPTADVCHVSDRPADLDLLQYIRHFTKSIKNSSEEPFFFVCLTLTCTLAAQKSRKLTIEMNPNVINKFQMITLQSPWNHYTVSRLALCCG